MEWLDYCCLGKHLIETTVPLLGGESTVAEDDYSRALQELQQPQTTGPWSHSPGGSPLTGTAFISASSLNIWNISAFCLCVFTLRLIPSLQDIETTITEFSKLERQSTPKHTHAPDVVLDTLEQLKSGGGASEPSSPLHSRLLRDNEGGSHAHPLQRSASSASDVPSSFRPAKSQPRNPLPSATSPSLTTSHSSSLSSFRESRPPATRPKPVVFPKGGGGSGSPAMGSPTSTVPPTPPPPPAGHTHSLPHTPPPPPPSQSNDKSCPA